MASYFTKISKAFALLLLGMFFWVGAANGSEKPSITLLTLGSSQCVSCQLMGPILDRLRDDYSGKVTFSYIDVNVNRGQARAFRLRKIPTLIFYDSEFREIYRHEGFWGRDGIVQRLDQMITLDNVSLNP